MFDFGTQKKKRKIYMRESLERNINLIPSFTIIPSNCISWKILDELSLFWRVDRNQTLSALTKDGLINHHKSTPYNNEYCDYEDMKNLVVWKRGELNGESLSLPPLEGKKTSLELPKDGMNSDRVSGLFRFMNEIYKDTQFRFVYNFNCSPENECHYSKSNFVDLYQEALFWKSNIDCTVAGTFSRGVVTQLHEFFNLELDYEEYVNRIKDRRITVNGEDWDS